MRDSSSGPGALNLAALTVGVTGIATVLGGLSLTGTVGRVLRNDPGAITWAFALVLVGGAFLVLAGLPATAKRAEWWLSVLGLELTLAGMLFAGIAGIRSGGTGERPAMTAELADGGRVLEGTVTAGNLASDARVVVLAYGVAPAGNGTGAVTELHRADIGPDGDGKVEYVLNAPVTGGSYETVLIASWSTSDEAADSDEDGRSGTRCHDVMLVRTAQDDAPPSADTACISLPMRTIATAPTVAASWQGAGGAADRLEVRVAATNAQPVRDVALVVKGRRAGRRKPLYRAVMQTDADGSLDRVIQVPVPKGFRRVCVGAAFISPAAGQQQRFPSFRCHGKAHQLLRGDRTGVQMKLPDPAARPKSPAQ